MVGETGSGKTTLLRCINGLVPHFSGGTLGGTVTVDGRSTRDYRPRDLADVVGFVGQNPLASFVTERVEDELAYTMENLGVPPDAMRRRVEDTLDLLGLQELRDRPLAHAFRWPAAARRHRGGAHRLSSRARSRRADLRARSRRGRGSADALGTAGPRSRPDRGHGGASARAGAALCRPARARPRAADDPLEVGPPERVMRTAPVAPPLIELGRAVGWDPLPLTVRDARRLAPDLRARIATEHPARMPTLGAAPADEVAASASRLTVSYGPRSALGHGGSRRCTQVRSPGSWDATVRANPHCSPPWPAAARQPGCRYASAGGTRGE